MKMARILKKMCRLCAASDNVIMKDILNTEESDMKISDIIFKYMGFPVSLDDMFPKMICETCIKKISTFNEYVEQCLKVQQFFIKLSEGDAQTKEDIAFQNMIKSEFANTSFDIGVEIPIVKDEEILIKQEINDYDDDDDMTNSFADDGLDYPVSALLVKKSRSKKKLKSKKKKSKLKILRSSTESNSCEEKPKFDPNIRNYFKFSCYVCNETFPNWFRLKGHIIEDHKVPAKVACTCGCVVKSKTAIYRHVGGHNDPASFACDKCTRITKTQEALDRHKMRHIPKPDRTYNCSGCTKVFNSKENLKSHERVHIPLYERYIYPCTICGNKFTTKSAVVGHTRAVHEKIKRYICDICGYACSTGGELIQHRAIHSEEKHFQCPRCPKKFKTGSNLKAHLDTHDSTSYPCKMCTKVLNSRRTYRKHLLVHDDLCRHVCSFCNKAFKRRQTLKVHLTSHTGDTPVQCPWCPQKFAYSSACRTHKQRCHPEQLAMLSQANNTQPMAVAPDPPIQSNIQMFDTESMVNICDDKSMIKLSIE